MCSYIYESLLLYFCFVRLFIHVYVLLFATLSFYVSKYVYAYVFLSVCFCMCAYVFIALSVLECVFLRAIVIFPTSPPSGHLQFSVHHSSPS